MNKTQAYHVATGFIQSFFDTAAALFGGEADVTVNEPVGVTAEAFSEMVQAYPLIVYGAVNNMGLVVAGLSEADGDALVSGFTGGAGFTEAGPGPEALAALREIFESCLGGGVGYLKNATGRELAPSDIQVGEIDSESVQALVESLNPDGAMAAFRYRWGAVQEGAGFIALSGSLLGEVGSAVASSAATETGQTGEGMGAPMADSSSAEDESQRDITENLEMILDIRLDATARLGSVEMPLQDILSLGPGAIVEIGHSVDEPVDLFVNGKLIARGDVVVVEERFGLRITEIVSQRERIESLR